MEANARRQKSVKFAPSSYPRKWDTDEVCAFLEGRGIPDDITKMFRESLVNGLILFELTDNDLIDMGMNRNDQDKVRRFRVLKEIKELLNSHLSGVRPKAQGKKRQQQAKTQAEKLDPKASPFRPDPKILQMVTGAHKMPANAKSVPFVDFPLMIMSQMQQQANDQRVKATLSKIESDSGEGGASKNDDNPLSPPAQLKRTMSANTEAIAKKLERSIMESLKVSIPDPKKRMEMAEKMLDKAFGRSKDAPSNDAVTVAGSNTREHPAFPGVPLTRGRGTDHISCDVSGVSVTEKDWIWSNRQADVDVLEACMPSDEIVAALRKEWTKRLALHAKDFKDTELSLERFPYYVDSDVVEKLMGSAVLFLQRPELRALMHDIPRLSRGVILGGLPKRSRKMQITLAQALAVDVGANLIVVTSETVKEVLEAAGTKPTDRGSPVMQMLLSVAAAHSPCIVYFEGIDGNFFETRADLDRLTRFLDFVKGTPTEKSQTLFIFGVEAGKMPSSLLESAGIDPSNFNRGDNKKGGRSPGGKPNPLDFLSKLLGGKMPPRRSPGGSASSTRRRPPPMGGIPGLPPFLSNLGGGSSGAPQILPGGDGVVFTVEIGGDGESGDGDSGIPPPKKASPMDRPKDAEIDETLSMMDVVAYALPKDPAVLNALDDKLRGDNEAAATLKNRVSLIAFVEKAGLACPDPEAFVFSDRVLTDTEMHFIVKRAVKKHIASPDFKRVATAVATADASAATNALAIPGALFSSAAKDIPDSKGVKVGKDGKIQKDNERLELDEYETNLQREVIRPDQIGVKFKDIGGLGTIKKAVKEKIIMPIKNPKLFSRGILSTKPKGLLLFGPPGTGKTMMAKAIATEVNASFISISPASIGSKWVGESEKYARAVFTLARKIAPSVIFIDEIDAIFATRSGHESSVDRKVKNVLMQEWDGLRSAHDQVLVLGATNRPMDLDDAILRRLETRIMVGLPDAKGCEKILKLMLKDDELDDDLDLKHWSQRCMEKKYNGSDLKLLCREAAMARVREFLKMRTKAESTKDEADADGASKAKEEEEEKKAADPTTLVNADASKDSPKNFAAIWAMKDDVTEQGVKAPELARAASLHEDESSAALRPITTKDFEKAFKKVAPSSPSDALMEAVRAWDSKFGEGGAGKGSGRAALSLYT